MQPSSEQSAEPRSGVPLSVISAAKNLRCFGALRDLQTRHSKGVAMRSRQAGQCQRLKRSPAGGCDRQKTLFFCMFHKVKHA